MADDRVREPRTRPKRDSPGPAYNLILDAVERLLAEQSLLNITIDDVLDEANTSRATFYKYFTSKFGVLAALLFRVNDEISETVQPFLAHEGTPAAALRESMDSVVDVWHRHRHVFNTAVEHWHDSPQVRDPWLEIVEGFVTVVASRIEADQAAGLVRASVEPRPVAASLLWSVANLLYVSDVGASPDLRLDAVGGLLADMWIRVLYDA